MKGDSTTYVFGYGSLMSPESIAESLQDREIRLTDLIPCRLDGYIRRWNACVPYIIEDSAGRESTVDVVFLNIERRDGAFVNGTLLSALPST